MQLQEAPIIHILSLLIYFNNHSQLDHWDAFQIGRLEETLVPAESGGVPSIIEMHSSLEVVKKRGLR